MPVLPHRSQPTRVCCPGGVGHVRSGLPSIRASLLLTSQISRARVKCGTSWSETSWTTLPPTCRRTMDRTISLSTGIISNSSACVGTLICLLCSWTSGTPCLLRGPLPFTHQGQWLIQCSASFPLVLLAYLIILTKSCVALVWACPKR